MDDKTLNYIIKRFDSIEELIKDSDEKNEQRKDYVFNKLDSIYKEILDVRQEQSSHLSNHQRTEENLDEYNKRLKKLEVAIAHKVK